jgi:hypothetical protein
MRRELIVVLAGALFLGSGLSPVLGQEKEMKPMQEQMQMQEQVYGWQLMSEQERLEHRQKMQQMKTEEEREAFRREHHEKMQERARQMGVTLPEEPGQRGKGMGPGSGMGPGGGGMGPGGGGMGGGKR